ncbi:hypothetical protein Ec53638_A0116 (plasmid) [Escherichia coli 53638]|nr:hypothetical protein Ec53638_A0116 [Escherichia coli 53638]
MDIHKTEIFVYAICAGKWRVNYIYSLHDYRISRFIFQLRNSCE